jgi:hypothetical protein
MYCNYTELVVLIALRARAMSAFVFLISYTCNEALRATPPACTSLLFSSKIREKSLFEKKILSFQSFSLQSLLSNPSLALVRMFITARAYNAAFRRDRVGQA